MKKIYFILAILGAGLLQVTFLNYFKFFSVKPNLLLILLVIASISFNLRWSIAFAITIGLFKDILTINTLTINIFLFTLWGFLIFKASKKITIDNNYIFSFLVLITVIIHDISVRIILLSSGKFSVSLGMFLAKTILESCYTALAAPLVFKGLRKII